MKKINLMILALLWISSSAQQFEWAKRGGLWAYDYGNGIASDNAGNVYIAGKYEQNANFSGVILPCQGNHDNYVAKYSPSGALTWIRTSGGYTGDYATCVATDSKFVYTAGEIEGTNNKITFVGSPITLTCLASNDIFLAKYDLNGNLIWARRAGGYDSEKALGISYDAAGNVYICGVFISSATFGGNTTVSSRGERDAFVAKYDANGNFLWVRSMGSPGRDEAKAIKCDAAGNVYVCGKYKNNCNFSGQMLYAPNGYVNAFVAKYSTNGTLQWVKTGGGNYDDVAWGITLDNYGKVFIAGEFNASAKFSGVDIYTTGSADVFVACYTGAGTIQWVKKAGGSLEDRARGIGTDGNNLFITGQFGGTAYFGNTIRYAADKSDIFMAALSNNGTFLWANSVGGPADKPEDLGFESGIAICAGPSGNVYATGSTLDGGSFGSTYISPFTRTDVFVTKLKHGVQARENDEPPLASEELAFTGENQKKDVALNWIYSASEEKDIILEKSEASDDFVALQNYWSGETKTRTNFAYTDTRSNTANPVKYRLRLIDKDGATSFSRVLSIDAAADETGIKIFPNPAQTNLTILTGTGNEKLQVSVLDMSGREIWKEEVQNGCCKLDVSPWTPGMYVVIVRNNEAILARQKVLKE